MAETIHHGNFLQKSCFLTKNSCVIYDDCAMDFRTETGQRSIVCFHHPFVTCCCRVGIIFKLVVVVYVFMYDTVHTSSIWWIDTNQHNKYEMPFYKFP